MSLNIIFHLLAPNKRSVKEFGTLFKLTKALHLKQSLDALEYDKRHVGYRLFQKDFFCMILCKQPLLNNHYKCDKYVWNLRWQWYQLFKSIEISFIYITSYPAQFAKLVSNKTLVEAMVNIALIAAKLQCTKIWPERENFLKQNIDGCQGAGKQSRARCYKTYFFSRALEPLSTRSFTYN